MFNCVCMEAEKYSQKRQKQILSHIKVHLEKLPSMCHKTYFPQHACTQEDERFLHSPANNNKVRGKHSCVCVTMFRCVHLSSIQQCSLGAAVIFPCNEQTCRHAFTDKEEWHLKVTFLWAQQKTITRTSYMCVCTQV